MLSARSSSIALRRSSTRHDPKATRLLHLTPLAAIGGCELNALRVIQGLPEHRHDVLVFDDPGPISAKWEEAGANVEHLAAWRRPVQRFTSALCAWARDRPVPDGICYWSTSRLPAVYRSLAQWSTRWAVHLGNPVQRGWNVRLRRYASEKLFGASDSVVLVACSQHVAKTHREATYFRRFRTEVVYNAVDPEYYLPRVHRPFPSGRKPLIGMTARLDKIKDHMTVLEATARLKDRWPELEVQFAGDGEWRDHLGREARRLGVSDRVNFLGFVDVAERLKSWDIYVHSTTEAEGMGTAVAEAMMTGLPCLVTDLAVMHEVCGPCAEYVRPRAPAAMAEKLDALLNNQGRREELGRQAQRRARLMFSRSKVANAYLKVITPWGRRSHD